MSAGVESDALLDGSVEPPSAGKDKYWNEMTKAERDAAETLGWDEVRSSVVNLCGSVAVICLGGWQ